VAKLVIRSEGFGEQVIRLKLGVNHLGRGPDNDFRIEHPTVSSRHCEIQVKDGSLLLRDCDSTNGTFVERKRIEEDTPLLTGHTFHLGEVEFFVETTEFTLSIPNIEVPTTAPPLIQEDGSILCPRHTNTRATYQCTHCREVLCNSCVHRLRRRKGKVLILCPLCSFPCTPLGPEKPKRRSLLDFLQTVKIPFLRKRRTEE